MTAMKSFRLRLDVGTSAQDDTKPPPFDADAATATTIATTTDTDADCDGVLTSDDCDDTNPIIASTITITKDFDVDGSIDWIQVDFYNSNGYLISEEIDEDAMEFRWKVRQNIQQKRKVPRLKLL